MRSDMVQAIGDLIKSGNPDTDGNGYAIPNFQVDNIYKIFKPYFNAEAQKAFETKATHLIHERVKVIMTPGLGNLLKKLGLKSCQKYGEGIIKRDCDKVCFVASRADRATVYRSVEKIINTVNILAKQGYMTAGLLELGVLALAPVDKPEPEYVVISYIALTNAGEVFAMANMPKMFVNEGQMPERFEDQ